MEDIIWKRVFPDQWKHMVLDVLEFFATKFGQSSAGGYLHLLLIDALIN